MAEKNIYPADNVDKDGVAYPTVGENIRNGKNSASLDFTSSDEVSNWLFGTLSEQERMMLPIFPSNVRGHWEDVVDTITNGIHKTNKFFKASTNRFLTLDGKCMYILPVGTNVTDVNHRLTCIVSGSTRIINNTEKIFIVSFSGQTTDLFNGEKYNYKVFVSDED